MNAQVQPPNIEIVFKVSLPAAYLFLEGLSKLSIERAGGLYGSLQERIDNATAEAIAGTAPAPPQPSAEQAPALPSAAPPLTPAPAIDLSVPPAAKEESTQ